MGSTLSIVNETQCPLNIALKQATPLYYENKVMPGDTIKKDVGKVWFTLEAKLWNGENDYETRRHIVGPLTMVTLSPILIPFVGLPVLVAAGAYQLAKPKRKRRIGNVYLPTEASDEMTKTIDSWMKDCAVRQRGIYMGRDRTIRIRGGPRSEIIEGKVHILSDGKFQLFFDDGECTTSICDLLIDNVNLA